MRMIVMVQSERPHSFKKKDGSTVNQQKLALLDRTNPANDRMINTFDFVMTDEDKVKYSGKVEDKFLRISYRDDQEDFSGRKTVVGQIYGLASGNNEDLLWLQGKEAKPTV